MNSRTLGADLNVSAIGLGCMGFRRAWVEGSTSHVEYANVLESTMREWLRRWRLPPTP